MVVEYLLLLLISVVIILAPFIQKEGPVAMFKKNGGNLATNLVAPHLETGEGFCDFIRRQGGGGCSWRQ